MNEAIPLQMVVEMARNIPCAPWILPQLMDLLGHPEKADAQNIQAIMMKDSGLVSAVLRTANSAHFSGVQRCESVAEAVLRIGFREVYRLTVGSVAGRWLNQEESGYGWESGDLCKHSLCVAVGAEYIAREREQLNVGLAYTAGLLHDVGKLALAHACAEQFEQVRIYQQTHGVNWRQAEHEVLGYDHTDVGGVLMQAWSFPTSLVQVACFYPRPKLSAQDHRSLVVCIHAAKHLAISLGYGLGEEGFSTELDEEALKEEGYTPEFLENALPTIQANSEKLITGTLEGIA
jgi:putative nucleotidyltransferase with HDIG domain